MTERRAGTENPPGYDELPEFVKAAVTPKEYAWLGTAGRARLVQDLTEPDWEEP
jgi:hypothetical protein